MKNLINLYFLLFLFSASYAQVNRNPANFTPNELKEFNYESAGQTMIFHSTFVKKFEKFSSGFINLGTLKQESGQHKFSSSYGEFAPALITNQNLSEIKFISRGTDYYFDTTMVNAHEKLMEQINNSGGTCSAYNKIMKEDSTLIINYYKSKINSRQYFPVAIPLGAGSGENLIAWYPNKFEYPYNLFHSIDPAKLKIFKKYFYDFSITNFNPHGQKTASVDFKIVPNPASGNVNIMLIHIHDNFTVSSIDVVNKLGEVIVLEYSNPIIDKYTLNISGLQEGLYKLRIGFQNGEYVINNLSVVKQ